MLGVWRSRDYVLGAQKSEPRKQFVFGFGLDANVDTTFGPATDEDKSLLGGKV